MDHISQDLDDLAGSSLVKGHCGVDPHLENPIVAPTDNGAANVSGSFVEATHGVEYATAFVG
jgi:hypothetical protein